MPIFTDSYLNTLLEDAEVALSESIPCIFDRFSLSVTAGTAVYTLPDTCFRLIEITWKGDALDPMEWADFQGSNWIKPQSLSQQGLPKNYLRVGNGWNKVMFHPTPDETIAASDVNLELIATIKARVIISCYRLAVPSGSTYRMPDFFIRHATKYYAMSKAYLKEGPGQNLIAAEYFLNKYNAVLRDLKKIVNEIPKNVAFQLGPSDDDFGGRSRPPRPTLPTTGKWSI